MITWPINWDLYSSPHFIHLYTYPFLFGVQTFFLMFSARGTARRLVYNVLGVELGVAGTSGIKKQKKPKQAKSDKKQKRF